MTAKEVAEFVLSQDQAVKDLQERVRRLEDGLKLIVTQGDDKASAMAWKALNEASQ